MLMDALLMDASLRREDSLWHMDLSKIRCIDKVILSATIGVKAKNFIRLDMVG